MGLKTIRGDSCPLFYDLGDSVGRQAPANDVASTAVGNVESTDGGCSKAHVVRLLSESGTCRRQEQQQAAKMLEIAWHGGRDRRESEGEGN
jgi:hypothetical protein